MIRYSVDPSAVLAMYCAGLAVSSTVFATEMGDEGKRGGTGPAAVAATRRIGLPVRAATADVLNPRCFGPGLRQNDIQDQKPRSSSIRPRAPAPGRLPCEHTIAGRSRPDV